MDQENGMDLDRPQVIDEQEEAEKREEKERIKNEKRQVRQGYRTLIANTEGIREEHGHQYPSFEQSVCWPVVSKTSVCLLIEEMLALYFTSPYSQSERASGSYK
jgi:hypothetical protein